MSKYKIVVSDTVIVKIVATLKGADGRDNQYKFDLICKRKGAEELKEKMGGGETIKDLLHEVTTDWRGQRLVLESDDTPAEFSTEAFDCMLDIAGMGMVLFNSYLKQVAAAEKN